MNDSKVQSALQTLDSQFAALRDHSLLSSKASPRDPVLEKEFLGLLQRAQPVTGQEHCIASVLCALAARNRSSFIDWMFKSRSPAVSLWVDPSMITVALRTDQAGFVVARSGLGFMLRDSSPGDSRHSEGAGGESARSGRQGDSSGGDSRGGRRGDTSGGRQGESSGGDSRGGRRGGNTGGDSARSGGRRGDGSSGGGRRESGGAPAPLSARDLPPAREAGSGRRSKGGRSRARSEARRRAAAQQAGRADGGRNNEPARRSESGAPPAVPALKQGEIYAVLDAIASAEADPAGLAPEPAGPAPESASGSDSTGLPTSNPQKLSASLPEVSRSYRDAVQSTRPVSAAPSSTPPGPARSPPVASPPAASPPASSAASSSASPPASSAASSSPSSPSPATPSPFADPQSAGEGDAGPKEAPKKTLWSGFELDYDPSISWAEQALREEASEDRPAGSN